MEKHIEQFERSGLARISDINNELYRELFAILENEQKTFFNKSQSITVDAYFRKWPKDTLHWWSRIWEYPYVFYHIDKAIQSSNSEDINILDFGCGVNFFSLAVSRICHKVFCVDNDKMCIDSLANYKKKYPEYRIAPLLNNGIKIPLPDKCIDIIYSVSVFEHVPKLNLLIEEISRVMKDDGYLIITFDVSLNDNYEITKKTYCEFIEALLCRFILGYPYQPFHPNEILNSRNSPFPYDVCAFKNNIAYKIKNHIVRPLLFKKPNKLPPQLDLAVEGMVLRKKV